MEIILLMLANAGTEKITFVGGEPTLCPYLGKILVATKSFGIKTMIVSNGTGITTPFLNEFQTYIDWIGLSIESSSERVQHELGRGFGNHIQKTIERSNLIRDHGINLKINTVITKLNLNEDFHYLIEVLRPQRWKVFQVLPIKDQNEKKVMKFQITKKEFHEFCVPPY